MTSSLDATYANAGGSVGPGGRSPVARVTDHDVECMYAAGYAKYEAMEYRAALDHFLASILHNPFDARFQLSAGACLAELGDYERALAHYSVAGTLDPDNIEAMIFASECLIRAGNDEAAKAGLSMVLAQTGEGEADSRARSRASELLRAHYPEVRQAR